MDFVHRILYCALLNMIKRVLKVRGENCYYKYSSDLDYDVCQCYCTDDATIVGAVAGTIIFILIIVVILIVCKKHTTTTTSIHTTPHTGGTAYTTQQQHQHQAPPPIIHDQSAQNP
ncbi:uncharacterized protein LOC143075267 [Mytilus galloprovincialis]|uniref:uncharacterized protein LOC143075267 n=1 Tax=Mytilus galloprovincialis TaxID=29158 RepID=UPI003F7B7E8A